MLDYRELITTVAHRVRVSPDEARTAAEATIATLAQTVDEPQRRRLLEAVPASLRQEVDAAPGPAPDVSSFVSEVSWLTGTPAEQARYRAQAVLVTLAERDPDLVASLDLPDDIRQLYTEFAPGGGITGPRGHTAPMTPAELAAALAELPDWSGDNQAISRTLTLPPQNLERVLARIQLLRQKTGRGPDIRLDGDVAVITVRTVAADAVTHLDIDLARHIDTAIGEAAAGIAS